MHARRVNLEIPFGHHSSRWHGLSGPVGFSVRGIPESENAKQPRNRAEFTAARRAMRYQIFTELP
jgi:hypothetical protein